MSPEETANFIKAELKMGLQPFIRLADSPNIRGQITGTVILIFKNMMDQGLIPAVKEFVDYEIDAELVRDSLRPWWKAPSSMQLNFTPLTEKGYNFIKVLKEMGIG